VYYRGEQKVKNDDDSDGDGDADGDGDDVHDNDDADNEGGREAGRVGREGWSGERKEERWGGTGRRVTKAVGLRKPSGYKSRLVTKAV